MIYTQSQAEIYDMEMTTLEIEHPFLYITYVCGGQVNYGYEVKGK